MYGTETKYLKRSVKNNIRRFPAPDFMFELTKDELESLRCNFSTLNKGRGQHPKYMPYAFSELGVSMLSSVLNSDTAIEIKGFRLFPRFRYWYEVLEELIYFSHRKYNLFIL